MGLRPYQETAADFLYGRDRSMILAPVGAGKTCITLTAMQGLGKFLVVAPKRVAVSVWPTETKKWAPGLSVVSSEPVDDLGCADWRRVPEPGVITMERK